MKNNKITTVYARTSSKNQNLKLQLEAASPYLKGIEPAGLLFFIDEEFPESSQPLELINLIDLIRKDLVDTLVVFDRSRLTSSVDNYLQLVNLINRHQVKVIFTSTGEENHRFENLYSEGLTALMLKLEGIMLSNRIKESKKRK
jgi:DNA invertase Pin-like site-specific DNA recombinase